MVECRRRSSGEGEEERNQTIEGGEATKRGRAVKKEGIEWLKAVLIVNQTVECRKRSSGEGEEERN